MAEQPPLLYFVRHGETDWNRARRIQGQVDIPLNAAGRTQAAAVARRLKEIVDAPESFDFHSSPLGRARQTMAAVLSEFGLPEDHAQVQEGLAERGFGKFEGRTWPEMFQAGHDPEDEPAAYHDWRPEGGESFADVAERVAAWLAGVRRPAIIVSHSAVSRVLRGLVLSLDKADIVHLPVPQHRFFRIDGGDVAWFDLGQDRS